MSGLLVLVAAEVEARGLARELRLRRLATIPASRFGAGRLEIRVIGLRAAALSARALHDREPPDLVISAGCCGALSPVLGERGALVLPEVVLPPVGPPLVVDPRGHARALAAAARAGLTAATGPLATRAEVVDTPTAKAALAHRTGAIAVDMESAAVLAMARACGLAAIVVRGVSDGAAQSLPPELVQLVDGGGRTRPARVAALALRRPAFLGEAWALRRGILLALRGVAAVLRELGEPG